MIIMHTVVGQIIYVYNDRGCYNVFSLPICRAVFTCTPAEAGEAIKHFVANGTALRVEYTTDKP
jgi:hypothetical protein